MSKTYHVCMGCGATTNDPQDWIVKSVPEYGAGKMLILCPDCRKHADHNKILKQLMNVDEE